MIDPIRSSSFQQPSPVDGSGMVRLAHELELHLRLFEDALRSLKQSPQLVQDAEFVKACAEHVQNLSRTSQKALEV